MGDWFYLKTLHQQHAVMNLEYEYFVKFVVYCSVHMCEYIWDMTIVVVRLAKLGLGSHRISMQHEICASL